MSRIRYCKLIAMWTLLAALSVTLATSQAGCRSKSHSVAADTGRTIANVLPEYDGLGVRCLVFGDSGTGGEKQYQLAGLMPGYEPDMVLHVGDLVVPDGAADGYQEKVFTPYHDLLERVPFFPTPGNHDFNDYASQPMFATFVLPENGPEGLEPERCYWFDYGPARFVAFDSNLTYEQLHEYVVPWLDKVLAGAGDRWKIVWWHHPVLTNGNYPPSGKILSLIVPLLDKHEVAITFCGHNHMYERSYPIRNDVIIAGESNSHYDHIGTIYVTTGAGGDDLYSIDQPRPEYLAIQDNSQHSFTIMDIFEGIIEVCQIGEDDSPIDQFAIQRITGKDE